jgi:hypothetical protein
MSLTNWAMPASHLMVLYNFQSQAIAANCLVPVEELLSGSQLVDHPPDSVALVLHGATPGQIRRIRKLS